MSGRIFWKKSVCRVEKIKSAPYLYMKKVESDSYTWGGTSYIHHPYSTKTKRYRVK